MAECLDPKPIITIGRDFSFFVDLEDEKGKPSPITGFTFIKARMKDNAGGSVDFFSPLTIGVNEQQTITYDNVPDTGAFKLKAGNETTVSLAFNASNITIQNALNALNQFSGIVVTGDFNPTHTLDFLVGDTKRAQPLLEIIDNTLKIGVTDIVVTVLQTVKGKGDRGIDVIDDKITRLKIIGNEEDSVLLAEGNNQVLDLDVKIADNDLNIPPIKDAYDTVKAPF